MEEVKIGFFKRMKRSIFNFDEYLNFVNEKFSKSVKYILGLLVIVSLITTIAITYVMYTDMGTFTEMYADEQTKEMVTSQIESMSPAVLISTIGIIGFICSFFIYFIRVLYIVLISSLICFIVSKILGVKIKYSKCIVISNYAITLSTLLLGIYTAFNLSFGIVVKYFDIAYNAIIYIYIITALMLMKSDMIKTQNEVMEIKKVEKEVKEEVEEKIPEKKKKENKKDNKEKKEKKEKKEGKIEGEPEGSNA